MSDDLLPIIERIQKLQAMAEGAAAIGSIHEAASFAEAVQKMLLKHKLDMSVLDADVQNFREPQGDETRIFGKEKQRREPWLDYLAHAVCLHHGVQLFSVSGSNRIIFAGRKTDREVAVFLVGKLSAIALHLSDENVRINRQLGNNTRDFRRSFLLGFSHAIGIRLRDAQVAAERSSTALVLIMKNSVREAHDSFFDRNRWMTPGKSTSRMKYEADNASAYRSGRRAGHEADMSASGLGHGSQQRRIGSGT